ncbi:hypothetical protein Tco_0352372 [Tanacetum coccineum]
MENIIPNTSIFALLFSDIDDLSTLWKVEGWQSARIARLGDDDTFNFSMRGLLRLASWLDSYTESAIAAMAGVRFLIFVGVSELRVERDTYAPELLGDQELLALQDEIGMEEFIAGDERAVCIPKLQVYRMCKDVIEPDQQAAFQNHSYILN